MNKIRQIQELNKKELEQGISPNASWHTDYRDTAFIYFGGLPYELSEGDVITIFSQYGEPVFLKLARDKETGKSKGFGWLKYEDQRSTDLAVDNLGGASIGGRLISVDHARYKGRDDEDADEFKVGWEDIRRREGGSVEAGGSDTDMDDATPSDEDRKHKTKRTERIRDHSPLLREERELQKLIDEHDDEDPMKDFLIEEKKKEVDAARRLRDAKEHDGNGDSRRHRHHHHHRSSRSHRSSHRSRREDEGDDDKYSSSRRERSDKDRDREHGRDREGERTRDKDKDRESYKKRGHDVDRRRDDRDSGDDRDRRRERERDYNHDKELSHRRKEHDEKDDRDGRVRGKSRE